MLLSPKLEIALIAAGMVALAARLYERTHTIEDILYARRQLSAPLAELSLVLSQTPPWLLAALAIAAYRLGAAALWIALSAWLGVVVGALWLAPRARRHLQAHHSHTLARLINPHVGAQWLLTIRRSATLVVVVCCGLTIGVQLQWLAAQLALLTEMPAWLMFVCSVAVLLFCGLIGGLWMAAIVDATLAVALVVIGAMIAVSASAHSWPLAVGAELMVRGIAWHEGVLAFAFALGSLFLAAGGLAQPAAISRYLAQSEQSARRIAPLSLVWAALALAVALILGWSARAQSPMPEPLAALSQWMSPATAQTAWTALLCIGMASLLGNCIAAASSIAHDGLTLRDRPLTSQELGHYRWSFVAVLAFASAIGIRIAGIDALWFAWHALTASLAPLLIVRLSGKKLRPGSTLGSIWTGFGLTAIFHILPDTPGDLLERGVPFVAALGVALSGGERRRNPDRADRGDRTVHDHLPI